MSKKDIGIDLGTANTLVYVKTKGIVLSEPSVVAVDDKTGEILAVGAAAKAMLGRTPAGITAVRPLKDGVIADFEATGAMLRYFIKKALNVSSGLRPRAIICIPTGITAVERRAVEQAAVQAGVRNVHLMDEPMAAAIGAGLPVDAASGSMIVDIGGGTSEVAVISLGGIVTWKSVRVAGNALDDAIIEFIRKKYSISAGEHTAEDVKIKIGTVLKGDGSTRELVSGRNSLTGMPCSAYVNGDDIRCALLPKVMAVIDAIKTTLEDTPPELSSDILKSGITLTGGGALINGLDRLICSSTGMPVRIAEQPLDCVAIGAGMVLDKAQNRQFF